MIGIAVRQRAVCDAQGAEYRPPEAGSRVGIALPTMAQLPVHGLRVPEVGAVCGWYLWAGDGPTDDPDFYQPLCVEHLSERCPLAVPFLGLSPGWRFLTDGKYVDVWYDAGLLAATDV